MSKESKPFRQVRPRSIEELEKKTLLATTGLFNFVSGALTITGDANANNIVFGIVFGGGTWQVAVKDNGVPVGITGVPGGIPNVAVRTVDVKSIYVDSKEANDTIDLNNVDPAFGWGGVFPLDGAVTLIGNSGWDTINGSTFRDSITGNSGKDTINGYFGADTIVGGLDADLVAEPADVANDVIYGGEQAVNDLADASDDFLSGGAGNGTIYGGAGADAIYGDEGADILWGEDGGDFMWGGSENDTLAGGDGNDSLFGEAGVDILWGEASGWATSVTGSNDRISGGPDADTLNGQFGNDFLAGDNVDELWVPTEGANDGADSLYGGDAISSPSLSMVGGNDSLYGSGGVDTLKGRDGGDWLYGGSAGDSLYGDDGVDCVDGGAGNDTMYGGNHGDVMVGMEGCDTMYREDGNDYMDGGFGDDNLTTGTGIDLAYGGTGRDVIDGLADTDPSEGCDPPMMMGGSPEIQAEKGVIAFQDQRIDILFLEMLGQEDRKVYLTYRGFTAAHIDVIEKLLEEFLAQRG